MPRLQPPAPKERPAVLSSAAPPPAAVADPVSGSVRSDRKTGDVGAIAFIVLVILGLIAASRAFLLLGT